MITQKEAYPKARAALKAVELDDTLAEAHTSLGFVRQLYDWDWAGARSALRRAVELNPNYAEAHYVFCYHFVHLGQFDEAIAEMNRAMGLDPFSVEYMVAAADVFKDARQYDWAAEQCRMALEMDRNYGGAYLFLSHPPRRAAARRAAAPVTSSARGRLPCAGHLLLSASVMVLTFVFIRLFFGAV